MVRWLVTCATEAGECVFTAEPKCSQTFNNESQKCFKLDYVLGCEVMSDVT